MTDMIVNDGVSRPSWIMPGTETVPHGQLRLALRVAALLLVGVCAAAGLFARFQDLGSRPLAVDEYYFVSSVELILEHGVPRFETGGYYCRGILPQYLTAFSASVLGNNGFAYRLPSVIFNLAAVALAYFYARRFVGGWLALSIPAVLLVSSWQIEFARFARMYSAFQCFTILLLIAVDAAYFSRKWRFRYMPFFVVILAILSHEVAILLVPLLLLPLLPSQRDDRFRTAAHRSACVVASGVAVVLWVLLVKYAYQFDVVSPLPEGVAAPSSSVLRTPAFPFWSLGAGPNMDLAFACGALLATILAIWAWKHFKGPDKTLRPYSGSWHAEDILASLIVTAAILHQFVIALACATLLVFRYGVHRIGEHPKRVYALLGISLAVGFAWCLYALTDTSWLSRVDGGEFSLRWCLRRAFFGWPDFYTPVVMPWARELPLLGAAAAAALLYQVARGSRGPWQDMLKSPAFVVAYIALCLGVLNSAYVTTRYHFFIYPVILTTILVSLVEAASQFTSSLRWTPRAVTGFAGFGGAVVYVSLFAASSDFSPEHIARVAQPDIGYRTGKFERYAPTWYGRHDYESPARFVDKAASKGTASPVIVVNAPAVSYYLEAQHAVYLAQDDMRFFSVSRRRGTVDRWSNRRLLSTAEQVRDYTQQARVIWIVQPAGDSRSVRPSEIWGARLVGARRTFLSRDHRIEVLRVEKQMGAVRPQFVPAGTPMGRS